MRARAVAVMLAGGLLAAGCDVPGDLSAAASGVTSPAAEASQSPVPIASALPSPSPSVSPTPPAPVQGVVTIDVVDAGHAQGLHVGSSPATDAAAVEAFAAAVARWLDVHLTALQLGTPDKLAGQPLLDGAPDEVVATLTGDLARPDRLATTASYWLNVVAAGEPLWIRARVRVGHADGVTNQAEIVFVPGESGPVVLVAGPVGTVEPPA